MKVLVCPLDWGLGHATRCIPLVRALMRAGHDVLIGASGGGLNLLRGEFPGLEVFEFPGYPIRYSRRAATLLPVLLAQLPGMIRGMIAERRELDRIVASRGVDRVIADGRYGVRSRRVPTIFVTHQLFIRPPWPYPGRALAERVLLALNARLLSGFREIWIPDYPGSPNLSGDLSHRDPGDIRSLRFPGGDGSPAAPRVVFIGPLSRFQPVDRAWREGPARAAAASEADGGGGTGGTGGPGGATAARVDVLASVSGPEPQRSRFEAALRGVLQGMTGTRVLVRGLPRPPGDAPRDGRASAPAAGGLTEYDHLDGPVLQALFASAALVVARSGYTTLMEMASLGLRRVVLVPTPGQPEQEYLAEHLDAARIALGMDQDSLDLAGARERLGTYAGFGSLSGASASDGSPPLADFIREHPLFRAAAG